MPAPLYGADDPRRCSGNSVSEVLDKFRKNYDRIMSLPQETKEEKEFCHCIWLAEKEERERIYQTSIRPFRKATYPVLHPIWQKHFLKLLPLGGLLNQNWLPFQLCKNGWKKNISNRSAGNCY